MRLALFVTTLLVLVGCRSPQVAYHTRVCSASKCSPNTCQICPDVEQPSEFSIEELVQIGLANHPRIRETEHRIRSLQFRIPQELSLPDPIVNTTTHLAPVETAAGRQAFALGLSQKVVSVDRRATHAAIAHEDVCVAQAELRKIKLEIAEQIRVVGYQLLFVRESMQITKEDLESLAQIEELIVRQYEVEQSVSQQDVLNVQIEQSKIENQLTNLRQQEHAFQARLATLVNFAPATEFVLFDSLVDNAAAVDFEQLTACALAARPELESQLAIVRRDLQKICLASLQHRPDFTVGLNWIGTSDAGISPVANGDDAVLLGIGFNLPVYTQRIRAAVCEARAARLASTAKLEVIQDQIAQEIFETVTQLESVDITSALLRDDILPKSIRTLELSIEEYSTGRMDYNQLISNWRNVLKYRIALANLQSNRMRLLASLARQVGQFEPIDARGSDAGAISPIIEPQLENENQDAAPVQEIFDDPNPGGNQN